MSIPQITSLLEFCLTNTYFLFQGKYYEQIQGAVMGSPISPLIANIFMEEFGVKALSSTPSPFPLAKVCWWHLCHQQGRTQSGNSSTHQQPGPTHTVYSGTNTTRLTPFPRDSSHHTTGQHIQHFSLQETKPHRPISTLGQQPPCHCQTKCIQHISTQSQGSLLHTGPTWQGTPTYKVSITTVPISRLGPQPMTSIVYQPQLTKQWQQPQQQQDNNNNNNNNKKNITLVVPYMPGTG